MPLETRRPIDVEALRRRLPTRDASRPPEGARTGAEAEGWLALGGREIAAGAGRRATREEWRSPEHPDESLAIELVRCDSPEDALAALLERLDQDELAEIPPGPSELGHVSFAHPEGVPPAVYFVRGSVFVAVMSAGPRAAPALAWARRIDARLGSVG